jgi:transposase
MPLLYLMHEKNISNRPDAKSTGRYRIYPLREILNAIFFYVIRSGCLWRLVPHDDFPPWRSLYHYFRESSAWMEHRRGCTSHCASG